MAGLCLMIFISMKAGNPPMPYAHTLPFSILWLWGAGDSPRGWHGRKIMARHRHGGNGCGRAGRKPEASAQCSCADAAASDSKY